MRMLINVLTLNGFICLLMRLIILTLVCKGLLISDGCHMRFATLVEKKKKRGVRDDIRSHKVHMNHLENRQASYRSNTWMGRTRTEGPDEFEPSKFDCMSIDLTNILQNPSKRISAKLLDDGTNNGHTLSQPAHNVGQPSARQRNAIQMF